MPGSACTFRATPASELDRYGTTGAVTYTAPDGAGYVFTEVTDNSLGRTITLTYSRHQQPRRTAR